MDKPEFSLIYPMHNEAENLDPLLQRTYDVLIKYYQSEENFEIICINDGSTDSTLEKLNNWILLKKCIKLYTFSQSQGHSCALSKGFELITASKYVMICDADLQYAPEDIPLFIQKIEQEPHLSIINGWRVVKFEPFLKRLTSKIYNFLMRLFFKTNIRDHASTFTLYRSNHVFNLILKKNDQRYLIPMIKYKWNLKSSQIIDIQIQHFPRSHGKSHYSVMKNILFGFYEIIQKYYQLEKEY